MENTQEIKTQVWCYHETGCRDYHLAALDGKVYSVDRVEVAPKPPQKFSLYGE